MVCVVIMGVAGSGKTTLGLALAAALRLPFVDGDDLHADDARAKMAAGVALTDDDRWPWLDRVAAALAVRDGAVLACSALKRAYRERLRTRVAFDLVYLAVSPEEAAQRLGARVGHFFAPGLLASQFDALESPGLDEDALALPAQWAPLEASQRVLTWIARRSA